MYNVVCVKWGDKYSPDYVNKLYAMVKRNLALPHTFYCFTEDTTGINPKIETRPLEDNELFGWWHKLILFKPEVYDLVGRTLYLDLDLVIVDNIDCFFDYTDPFIIIKDWNSRDKKVFWNSSVFSFEIGTYTYVWDRFALNFDNNTKTAGGDQRWLLRHIPKDEITTWPEEWCRSFKYECADGLPDGSKMIIFHGKPDPHEAKKCTLRGKFIESPWIDQYWRE